MILALRVEKFKRVRVVEGECGQPSLLESVTGFAMKKYPLQN